MIRTAAAMLALLLALAAAPGHAVQPGEKLDDPALEARAQALSEDIRCLVCQNQSIANSNADLARDLRVLVRERLSAGDSDAEVKDYLVERYGEYVLLRPRVSWSTVLLWATPALALGLGGVALAVWYRARRREAAAGAVAGAALSSDERARVDALLAEMDGADGDDPADGGGARRP